jgi:hypothetical protein
LGSGAVRDNPAASLPGRAGEMFEWFLQSQDSLIYGLPGLVIFLFETGLIMIVQDIRDNDNLLFEMVENNDATVQTEHHLRQLQIVEVIVGYLLYPPDAIVRKVAHRSACEARQSFYSYRLIYTEQFSEKIMRGSFDSPSASPSKYMYPRTVTLDYQKWIKAQEGVSSQFLPTLDRFQQEGCFSFLSKFYESTDRCFEIGRYPFEKRNYIPLPVEYACFS